MADKDQPDDLERRRADLEKALAERRPAKQDGGEGKTKGDMAGAAQALRLSSEFIAGVGVGAALGWFIDHFAGTSPWGLIIFLLLGFGAGVLNVLRSAGLVAEFGIRSSDDERDPEKK
ncbi:AtpZ/AtpI family protein [Nitratireductor rhodophyticola]|uniref:AtpZ/AtpI family protein n=1 Tax=Nitratireductor rhodophyticola TaxID=2854036 RepID=UPI003009DAE5